MAVIRASRPTRRAASSYIQFRQRIPQDVLPGAAGLTLSLPIGNKVVTKRLSAKAVEVAVSLLTADQAEARRRHAVIADYLENVWAALRRTRPISLTSRQATALSGELYRAWAEGEASEQTIAVQHTPQGWVLDSITIEEEEAAFTATVSRLAATPEESLDSLLGPIVKRRLLAKGIGAVDERSRHMLLLAFRKALCDALELRARHAAFDHTPDPNAARFPAWEAPDEPTPAVRRGASLSLPDLLAMWWQEAKATGRKEATYLNYARAVRGLCAFLKHDDALRITPDDIVAYKAWRLATINPQSKKPVSPRTVKATDLGGLKTIFQFAVDNNLLSSNPAREVVLKVGNRPRLRSKGFTDNEASALLRRAGEARRSGKESPLTFAARRWVPWLCAYSGARVGEIAQLRKEDIRREDGLWILRITPEAGTQKSNKAWDVVIHSHLIDEGFVDFVCGRPAGHLFLNVKEGGKVLGVLKGLKTRLAFVAREVVSDPNVAPNHGWRHRFKTIGREAGIPSRILDAIQGHSAKSVADEYGEVTLAAMAAALEKMPRVDVHATVRAHSA
jgi:integrase